MARQRSPRRPKQDDFQRIAYLVRETTPLYTVPELAERLKTFGEFLDEHRVFIIRTGLPPAPCWESLWLYRKLGRLYDTRATHAPLPHAEIFSNPRPGAQPYEWLRIDRRPSDRNHHLGSDYRRCEYHEADLLKGLEAAEYQADVAYIEQNRTKIFNLKRRIIARAEQGARAGSATGFWADCL
ncbi:MAG: hypothetical protein U0792_05570, partial [Gemmataceae bacterium]